MIQLVWGQAAAVRRPLVVRDDDGRRIEAKEQALDEEGLSCRFPDGRALEGRHDQAEQLAFALVEVDGAALEHEFAGAGGDGGGAHERGGMMDMADFSVIRPARRASLRG